MLNIYYGREKIDKEKFIYEKIAEKQAKTLVLVPDQYTLEAEKQAFRILHARGLMDTEIISMSRLGYRLLAEQGGGSRTFIDKYGRQMLLSQIISSRGEELKIFKETLKKETFIEMTNNFISEMKQYNVTPDSLSETAELLPEDSLLRNKLIDLQLIYSEYEKKIKGKYTDSEDYIDLYMEKIPKSPMIKDSIIWIYGFDSFAPKALNVLGHLMASAAEVNVFLTFDDVCRDEEIFQLTDLVMYNLEKQAELYHVPHGRMQVKDDYGRMQTKGSYEAAKENQAIRAVESELFSVGKRTCSDCSGITLVQAANLYNEAESAAAFVLHLIRDEGMRHRDIVVICNDQKVRGPIISRVFEEYGIKIFDDKKRNIVNSPMAIFVVSLIEAVVHQYRTVDIFKLLKTGFAELSDEETERLENYAIKYRIRGSMWKKPFVKGEIEYGENGLEEINTIRAKAMAIFDDFAAVYREAGTVREFIENYYDFLIEGAALDQRISALIELQESQEMLDLAEETSQIWRLIVNVFEQIAELMGDEKFSGETFVEMLSTGLAQMEVGVLPPTSDDILIGTMQRTRCGNVKAVIVVGANEGILPAGSSDEGLFSMDELNYLAEEGKELCKVEKIRELEEKLAIYRNLSKPSKYLWMSYSVSDEEGKEIRPSEVVDSIRKIFPELKIEKDVLNRDKAEELIGGRINTLKHLTAGLQKAKKGEKIDGIWAPVIDWFGEIDQEDFDKIDRGLAFTNAQSNLDESLTKALYSKEGRQDLSVSPSRLEKFSRCPFAHFVSYGLRPEERRIFQASGREIGDIYHKCLMEISKKLTADNLWNTISVEECRDMVTVAARREAADYREGLFNFSNEEKYKTGRIEDACFYVCWALIEQVRAGKIKSSQYEAAFGLGRPIKPVEIQVAGRKMYIEGKIDRLDFLDQDRVKIIDYKTGNENFDTNEVKGGYRLQLMLYLKAAQENVRKPAGVFYFLISDSRVNLTGVEKEKISEKISKEMRKSFRLNGIMISDGDVIDGIAGEFDGYSDVVPLRNGKEGVKATSEGFLVSEDEFAQLQTEVDRQVEKLCGELADGKISITPKKTAKETPCTYCEYKGICRFDLNFPGCNYEIIK